MNDESAHNEIPITLAGKEISVGTLARMEPAEIGMFLLTALAASPNTEFTVYSLRAQSDASSYTWAHQHGTRKHPPEYVELNLPQLLADAFAWLIARGLVGPASENSGSTGEFRVTSAGHRAAQASTPAHAEAAMRLHADLHPALAEARLNFERGSYQTAVFEATRQVEVHVRDLSGLGPGTYGVALMRTAFNPEHGPLATGEVAPEREAIASLYAGTIGAFKNPSGHRVVHFDDPTEAADIIHLADLLLRMAARAAQQ